MVDQRGVTYTASDYPVDRRTSFGGVARDALDLVAAGGSGPARPAKGSKDPLAGIAGTITPGRASNAVDLTVHADHAVVIAGAPSVRLVYSGTTGPGARPTAVFAQLVDDTTGLVVGNQVTPIALMLDGKQHVTTVALETIAFTLERGASLTLQIAATTVAYATPRLGGTVKIEATLALPESTLSPR